MTGFWIVVGVFVAVVFSAGFVAGAAWASSVDGGDDDWEGY